MGRRTKVCLISLKAYPLFNREVDAFFGGAEVDIYLLATELAKDDAYEVSCVVGDYGQAPVEQRENVTVIRSADVRSRKKRVASVTRLWRALCRADADIYMHEAFALETALIAFFCRCRKRTFIYRTAHTRETDGCYFAQHRLRGPLVRWAVGTARQLIVQNDQDAIAARETLGRESHVIRNGCRVLEIPADERQGALWVGRSTPAKRPELFLEVARRLPDERFTMICQRASGDRSYDALVREAEGIENLRFARRVPFFEIGEVFGKARLLISTSESEGFPNVFLQACQHGTGILSLSVNPDGFLTRHGCGQCAEGSMDRLVEMAADLLHGDGAEALGRRGIEYSRTYHDMTAIAQQYKDVFARG